MIFNHLVKHNGVYYKAGEDVPVEVGASTGAFTPSFSNAEEEVETEVVTSKEETPIASTEKKYTKTDINRLSTAELKVLAKENGIDGSKSSGAELKKMLINKLV